MEPVLRYFGLSSHIAHLHPVHLSPWPFETAKGCLMALASHYNLDISSEVCDAMLEGLGCFIPHHVQMYFGHVLDDCRSRNSVKPSSEDVHRVYQNFMLGPRGHAELADYEERLMRVLGKDLKPLALELLTEAAVSGMLSGEAALVIAGDYRLEASEAKQAIRSILDVLEHDGYLKHQHKDGSFVFVSNLLRDWWSRRFKFGFIPAAQRKK